MAYLVETNVMVDFTRGSVNAADYLDGIRGASVLSSITALELIAGARNHDARIAATAIENGFTLLLSGGVCRLGSCGSTGGGC